MDGRKSMPEIATSSTIADKRITLDWEFIDPESAAVQQQISHTAPLLGLWGWFRAIRRIGAPMAASFVEFGLGLAGQEDVEPPMHEFIVSLLNAFVEMAEVTADSDDIAEHVLGFTYALLRKQDLRPPEAAAFASGILHKPFTTEAWRRRVERWARANNLPQVEQRKRATDKNDVE